MRDIHENAVKPVFLYLLIFIIVGLLSIPGCTEGDNLVKRGGQLAPLGTTYRGGTIS